MKKIIPLTLALCLGSIGQSSATTLDAQVLAKLNAMEKQINELSTQMAQQQRREQQTTASQADVTPVGSVIAWPGETPPAGWLILNGDHYFAFEYPELYQFLKSDVLPDLRGLTIVGVEANQALLAQSPGQVLSHQHAASMQTAGDHHHLLFNKGDSRVETISAYNSARFDWKNSYIDPHMAYTIYGTPAAANVAKSSTAGGHQHAISVAQTGGERNMPAHLKMNWIIRAL